MSDGGKKAQDGDELFAETALQEGLLNESQIGECRRSQERLLKAGQRRTLAEIAAQKTLISQSQADRIQEGVISDDVPKMAGNYEILRQIGEGGMGRVYKARHVKLGNFAAVKFLPPHLAQDDNFVQRFEREAKLAAQLNSPYSVRTFDVVEVDGMRLILMEYVEGESLDDLLSREGRIEEKRALRVIHDVATALDEAHECGIIHRDIKPGNILLTRRGVPKVADLGLAKNVDSDQVNLTSIGAILGTPSYMSPEQAMGLPDLDNRSDIFSLGATFYRMVVGELPFKGDTPVNVMHKIATRPVPPPLTQNPALSSDTAAIICKMMAKDRNDRYQSMAAVTRDIEMLLAGEKTGLKYEETVALVSTGEQFTPATFVPPKRGKAKTALLAGVAVAVVLLALIAASQFGLFGNGNGNGAPKPPATASALLAKAREAADAKRWEQARSFSQKLVNEFPEAKERAAAAALLETATREVILEHLMRIAAEGELGTAVMKLKEAREKWPNDARIAGLQRTVDARIDKAYADAMAQGAAAETSGDMEAAAKAYKQAVTARATDEAKGKLASAQLRAKLALAGKTKDVRQKLLAITEVLQAGGDASMRQAQAKIEELIGVRRKALSARESAHLFRKNMPADATSVFLLADEKFAEAEKKLETLDPLAITAESLTLIGGSLSSAEKGFIRAAGDAFDKLYPGVDLELAGADFATGLLRLHAARKTYPNYAGIAQLLAKHDPGGSAMTAAAIIEAAKARSPEYASPKEAGEARAKLDGALHLCDKFKAETKAETKVVSLKALVLARRAAAQSASGAPLPALADAALAADLAGDEKEVSNVLSSAAAAAILEFGQAFKAAKAQEFVRRAGALLGRKEHAAARRALAKAVRSVPFVREFMLDTELLNAWSKTVAPFEPPAMAAVPAGVYSLGLKHEGLAAIAPSSSPEHPLKMTACFVDVHEVTNEEFQRFVDDGGYANDRWWAGAGGADRKSFTDLSGKPGPSAWRDGRFPKGEGKLPVTGVSFYEAAAYTRWVGKRLPTEAEWECAALAVPPTAGGAAFGKRSFPWGDAYAKGNANLRDAEAGKPEAVGARKKDKSALGCFDMTGNVREWTSSLYDPYPGTKCQDKQFGKGLASVRGASFNDSFIGASPMKRRPLARTERDAQVGFRCAWPPGGQGAPKPKK